MYDKELQTAIEIAKEAGIIMLKYFDIDQQVEVKSDKSPVTIADKLINSLVIKEIKKVFPDDEIIGEEESTSGYGMGRKWICDPIDGTVGYTWSVPTGMFSLAFVIDGKPIVGVAYDPFMNKMYTGVLGKQSKCNDVPIHVSNINIQNGVLGITAKVQSIRNLSHPKRLSEDGVKLACISGAVYKSCLVARGKFVGYVELVVNGHDVAAVHVIVEGAGGKVTAVDGSELDYSKPFKGAVVSNGLVHKDVIEYCREDLI